MDTRSPQQYEADLDATRPERMRWWRQGRFGMFVHWGLYSLLGRHEWVMAVECIPMDEYEALADRFLPPPGAPREWARLARSVGMTYLVLTAKHHDGFCLWDSRQTDFNAARRGPHRDLIAEYVDACREFGLRVGIYYSLIDWHHPDGAACVHDLAARRRFIDFTHGCVRELMTHYGRIDILWYDGAAPLRTAEGWESGALNRMVRQLQPDILINDRSRMPEDFTTSEGQVIPAPGGRGWEACMTFNDASWGYMPSAAIDSWRARDILKLLCRATGGQGNLLLNLGPAPDGSVPPEAVAPLATVGRWLALNGDAVYGEVDRAEIYASACGSFTRKGSIVYFWCRWWPGSEIPLGGFGTPLLRAWLLATGAPVEFEQTGLRIVLRGLPADNPDPLAGVAVIALEFAEPPSYRHGASIPAMTVQ